MALLNMREQMAVCRDLSSMAHGISGVRIGVYPIPVPGPDQNELAFTHAGRKIYIGFNHPIISEMEQDKALVFIYGLFAHELLHQLMTDFKILDHAIKRLPFGEKEIFAEINNILEDSSIEYFMPQFVGGRLIEDLNFMRAWLYKESVRIDEGGNENHPYFQFTAAFIQYGDAGLIKGSFTFPEAEKCFIDTIKLWEQGVIERHAHKRIQISNEIFMATRPLWGDIAKNKEMMRMLAELLRSLGKGFKIGSSGDTPLFVPEDEEIPESAREKRRKITFKRVSKEEAEKIMEEGSAAAEIPPDGDITILITDEEMSEDDSASKVIGITESSEAENNSEGTSPGDAGEEASLGSGKGKTERDGAKEKGAPPASLEEAHLEFDDEALETAGKEISRENDSSKPGPDTGKEKEGLSGRSGERVVKEPPESDSDLVDGCSGHESVDGAEPGERKSIPEEYCETGCDESAAATIEDELEIPDERLEELKSTLEKMELEMLKEEAAEDAASSEPLNLPLSSNGYENACKGKTCRNIDVKLPTLKLDEFRITYNELLEKIQTEVSMLASELRRLFANAEDDKARRTSGKVNIDRLCGGRLTSRVFDRRREPSDRSDVAAFLLVDESGSMGGNKIIQALVTAIGLAEALSDRIPVYVMGFRADKGADAVHYHYMRWRNTKDNRLKLLNIHAGGNNFDGYSIRYASELLKKRQEKHKLLIVISDGAPACNSYSGQIGEEDTRQAVREASQIATVIGVLVGYEEPDTHRKLYGYNFLHVKDASDLFKRIGGFLANLIKGW